MRRAQSESGFTLVEVLVSLAIFSLAILGLNRAATLAVSGTNSLQFKTYAGFVADNAVVRSRLNPLNVGLERQEAISGGLRFDVFVETSETESAGFYEILVRVSERDKERIITERRAFRYEDLNVPVETTPPNESDGT